MISSMEHNTFLVTGHKQMAIYEFSDKELKIIVLKKISEVEENTQIKTWK